MERSSQGFATIFLEHPRSSDQAASLAGWPSQPIGFDPNEYNRARKIHCEACALNGGICQSGDQDCEATGIDSEDIVTPH